MIRRKIGNLAWRLRHHRRWVAPNRRIREAVVRPSGFRVQSGPFAGMSYIGDVPAEEALVPRLLGCYESELHLPIEQFLAERYDTVIDIGSSEGYYAVGFALRSPGTRVYAFDTDEDMQRRCREMARLNRVEDRVTVGGECTPSVIEDHAAGRTLVISDCEGGEIDVLDPSLAPVLRECDLLVEVHDLFVPGASGVMRARFEPTHDIFVVKSMMQDERRYPQVQRLRGADRAVALDERRVEPMEWFMMRRRRAG